jgi:Haem-binding domain
MLKQVMFFLVLVLVVIQFFRPERNISAQAQPKALKQGYGVPASVETYLKKACYDCHSDNTRYPWYAEVQPVAWYLAHHVTEGKGELNFDEFLNYPAKKQDHKLEEVVETLEEGEMPLPAYTLIHKEAVLTEAQKKEIMDWASLVRKEIRAQNKDLRLEALPE